MGTDIDGAMQQASRPLLYLSSPIVSDANWKKGSGVRWGRYFEVDWTRPSFSIAVALNPRSASKFHIPHFHPIVGTPNALQAPAVVLEYRGKF
jgi:hypothetical protein